MNTEKNTFMMWLLRALAVVGIITILVLGIWGSIKVARYVPDAFSTVASAIAGITSVFVPAEPGVQISLADDTVVVNEPFTFSFVRTGSDANGVYHFAYSCHEGLSFEVPSGSGTFSLAACETPIALGERTSIRLVPVSTDNRFLDVTLGVSFTPEGDSARVVTTRQITVVNASLAQSDNTVTGTVDDSAGGADTVAASLRDNPAGDTDSGDNQNEGSTSATPAVGDRTDTIFPVGSGAQPSDPNGRPDLAPKILAVGTIDANNNFTPSASATVSDISREKKAAVQFEIENLGTRSSGQWSFNAVLPTSPIHIFSSPTQQSLAPGDKIVYTVGFDRLKSTGKLEFVVNADPRNNINEVSEENNIRKATVNVTQ